MPPQEMAWRYVSLYALPKSVAKWLKKRIAVKEVVKQRTATIPKSKPHV